jgi:hypothetical protein
LIYTVKFFIIDKKSKQIARHFSTLTFADIWIFCAVPSVQFFCTILGVASEILVVHPISLIVLQQCHIGIVLGAVSAPELGEFLIHWAWKVILIDLSAAPHAYILATIPIASPILVFEAFCTMPLNLVC